MGNKSFMFKEKVSVLPKNKAEDNITEMFEPPPRTSIMMVQNGYKIMDPQDKCYVYNNLEEAIEKMKEIMSKEESKQK